MNYTAQYLFVVVTCICFAFWAVFAFGDFSTLWAPYLFALAFLMIAIGVVSWIATSHDRIKAFALGMLAISLISSTLACYFFNPVTVRVGDNLRKAKAAIYWHGGSSVSYSTVLRSTLSNFELLNFVSYRGELYKFRIDRTTNKIANIETINQPPKRLYKGDLIALWTTTNQIRIAEFAPIRWMSLAWSISISIGYWLFARHRRRRERGG